jgi:hypothetical protein
MIVNRKKITAHSIKSNFNKKRNKTVHIHILISEIRLLLKQK